MPVSIPVPDKAAGDLFTEAMWDSYIRDNINKLLSRGHRVLTVAQFAALAADVEGTKGTTAPDEVYLEVDAANGIQWHLAYESGETTYKWRYLGGPPLLSTVATVETTASTTFTALATAGPSIALPRAGDYDIDEDFTGFNTSANLGSAMSFDVGGVAAVEADAAYAAGPSAYTSGHRRVRKTALTSVTVTAKYRATGGGTGEFKSRTLCVTPIRIRHDA